jgi:dicarboxylate transporter 10
MTLLRMGVKVVKNDGILGLYNGLSASLVRQLTYSTTRFGVYYTVQPIIAPPEKGPMPFYQKILLAGFAGSCGGVLGTPGDMVNVRMQNDMKIPPEQRRNYKHALDGILRVAREEGPIKLFNGCTMATCRACFMTIGQVGMYDQVKQVLLQSGIFGDNLLTHFSASTIAATIATTITQPLDVMKTRMMNAKPGEFKGIMDCFMYTLKAGPTAFFKGYVPAFVRLAPQTILTFVFFEQLRLHFGYFPPDHKKD